MFLVIDIISAATFGILAISAIASTYLFYNSKNKEREKETFDYIDDKFNDFLQICLDKPYLDIFDTADEKKSELNETQKKEEKIAFAYLMSIFERVYIFYVENRRSCDYDQFVNWTKTIKEYFRRENFRNAWKENGYGWDSGYIKFMDSLYLKIEDEIRLEEINSNTEIKEWYEEYKNHFVEDRNNDTQKQIYNYLDREKKYSYTFYKINNSQDKMIGGFLVQHINNCVFILYIFISKNHRNKGYGSLALRALRNKYDEKVFFLAEVEHRNKKTKPWWLDQMFEEVDMKYFTPEVNTETFKEKESHNENDLMIFYSRAIMPKELKKVIEIYFRTSFVQKSNISVKDFKSVKNNNNQLDKMIHMIETKIQ